MPRAIASHVKPAPQGCKIKRISSCQSEAQQHHGEIVRHLAKSGFLEHDTEQPYLDLDETDDSAMPHLHGSVIT